MKLPGNNFVENVDMLFLKNQMNLALSGEPFKMMGTQILQELVHRHHF